MKKMLTVVNSERLFVRFIRATLLLLIGLAVTVAFWAAMTPAAKARDAMTGTEMIQKYLPQGKTLSTATKQELLDAVCSAVKKWPEASPQIVRAAVVARRSFAGDIVATAIRCLGTPHNCDLIGHLVRAALDSNPDAAASIVEEALALAPDCREAIERAGHHDGKDGGGGGGGGFDNPVNINLPPGTGIGGGGGGGFNPEDTTCTVCENNRNIQIACSRVEEYLRNHPGDTFGPCPVTSTTNR